MSTTANAIIQADLEKSLGRHLTSLQPLRNAHVVVTGGTGFLGTWLASAIAYLNDRQQFGARITLIARNPKRFEQEQPQLAERRDIRLVAADVRHLFELPADTDFIIHAAGTPDMRRHASSPLEVMSTIALGTEQVLRAAMRCSRLKLLLNVSSGLVYGSLPSSVESVSESLESGPACQFANNAYAEAKRFGETLCAAGRSEARIPTASVRPFAFVGPFQPLDGPWAVTDFIRDSLSHLPIKVKGDGSTVRSYLYGSDMAAWTLVLLTKATPGQVFNLGSGVGTTLEELAQIVAKQSEHPVDVHLRTAKETAGRSRLVPDIKKAEALGLEVTIPLEEAIRHTVRWYRQQNGNAG